METAPLSQAVLAPALEQAVNLVGHQHVHLMVQAHEVTQIAEDHCWHDLAGHGL